MVDDLDILKICEVAENKIQYQNKVKQLFKQEFTLTQERNFALKKYNSLVNANKIIEMML